MSLTPGSTLGSYEIAAPLGAGGMGEVYRARDPKLERDVAIKVLPAGLADDPERLARFEREAKTLGALNHPNIATIHGFESDGDTHFLVIELVDGEDLATRLKRGPLPIDEALPLFIQIAEGLEAAHEKGIVHRDLKPANIMLTRDGRAKVLDFGLARSAEPATSDVDLSQSPTRTELATTGGQILGTAAYMSPEQARGEVVDRRSDLWSFGAVLFECVTGNSPFAAATATDTLASVLRSEVDWEKLPPAAPKALRRILERCLRRDANWRLGDAGAVRIELAESLAPDESTDAPPKQRASESLPLLGVVAVLALLIGSWFGTQIGGRRAEVRETPVRQLTVPLAENQRMKTSRLDRPDAQALVLSPDGRWAAYATRIASGMSGLGAPTILNLETREIVQLRDFPRAYSLTVSANSERLAFVQDSSLYVIRLGTSEATAIARLPNSGPDPIAGGAWCEDGNLYLGIIERGLYRLSPGAEALEQVLPLEEREFGMGSPSCLDGGRQLLVTRISGLATDARTIHLVDTASWESRYLTQGGNAVATRSGHLVFSRPGAVMAAAFDQDSGILGEARSVSPEGLPTLPLPAPWALDSLGTLAYSTIGLTTGEVRLALLDRGGSERSVPLDPIPLFEIPRLSVDGTKLSAGVMSSDGTWAMKIVDLSSGTATTFTLETGFECCSVWTHDGQRLVFASNREGKMHIYAQKSDGSDKAQLIVGAPEAQYPVAISSENQLFFSQRNETTLNDIYTVSLDAPNETPVPLIQTDGASFHAALSPNERWLAVMSREERVDRVVLYSLPDPASREPIAALQRPAGDLSILTFSPSGRELFVRTGQGIETVDLGNGDTPSPQPPQVLLPGSFSFDVLSVTPDGEHFLVGRDPDLPQAREIRIIDNWFEELRRLVPVN